MNKFYITNSIPYVNAKPHIGHALEFIQSDTITRYHKILGDKVLLLCGGDENAIKNVIASEKEGFPIQEFIDKNNNLFLELSKKLNVQFDVWQKGSDPKHHLSSQRLWELCDQNGDIYKKSYAGLYCVGCELFYEKEELNANEECHEHPGKKLDKVSEENYFFRLSKYQDALIKLLESNTLGVVPEFRKNEMLSFLKNPLRDISISRSNKRAKNWGVPVPNDASQRMYVWFDALNIYQSGIGFGSDEKNYEKWWPADLHVIGKGILRFHAIYWPAFLLSAGLKLLKKIFVHEYIIVDGQKMSKTVGNVLDPIPLIEKYGADALRYYLLAKISPFSDGDFSEEKFKETYNADLANGLGNLVARVSKLCEQNNVNFNQAKEDHANGLLKEIKAPLEQFKFNEALGLIWGSIKGLDQYINRERPWKKNLTEANQILSNIVIGTGSLIALRDIAETLKIFLPETAEQIKSQFKGPKIKSQKPLFPRI